MKFGLGECVVEGLEPCTVSEIQAVAMPKFTVIFLIQLEDQKKTGEEIAPP